MYYLIETKETFSAPTSSATNCSIQGGKNKEMNNNLNKKIKKPNQGSTSGNKPMLTHCVLTDILGHFQEAEFKERVDKKGNEWKSQWGLLLHFDNSVILKLKIVFNLCLCSFFKRTRNRATETSTATIPKMRISHDFQFSSFSPPCTANMRIARLICAKVN